MAILPRCQPRGQLYSTALNQAITLWCLGKQKAQTSTRQQSCLDWLDKSKTQCYVLFLPQLTAAWIIHTRGLDLSSQQLAYQFNCIFLQCKHKWSRKGLEALDFKYIHIFILHFVKGQEERGFVLQECCTSFLCYCFKLLPHKSLASYSKCRKLVTSAETLQRPFNPQHRKWNREIASARLLSCTKAELNTYSQTFNFWMQ